MNGRYCCANCLNYEDGRCYIYKDDVELTDWCEDWDADEEESSFEKLPKSTRPPKTERNQ